MVHRPPGLVRKCGKASRLFQTSVGIQVFWIPTEVSFSTGLFSFFLLLFLSFRGSYVCSDRGALLGLFLELVVLQTLRESDTFPIELMD